MLPEIPDWDGMHAFVAHFPIALLLVAPIWVVLGLLSRESRRTHWSAALILMVLGTLGACAAALTGQEAADVGRSRHAWDVLERHQELSEVSCAIFALLTLAFAGLVFLPKRLERKLRPMHIVAAHVVLLVLYAGGCLVLMHAGHEGGRLVYEVGLSGAPKEATTRPAPGR